MTNINCIIIDDELSARNILEKLLITHCPNISILDRKDSLLEGVERIKQLKPDLVFLDVEMPNYSGYEIINYFDKIDFQIVFVTAFDKYAINAFDVHAIDYVLKPIDLNKLIKAVVKVEKTLLDNQTIIDYQASIKDLNKSIPKTILLTENSNQHLVQINDIIAVEAQGAYSNVHLKNSNKILISKNIGFFENKLKDESIFFRPHNSWIINSKELINYSKTSRTINLEQEITAKLSRNKIKSFEDYLFQSII